MNVCCFYQHPTLFIWDSEWWHEIIPVLTLLILQSHLAAFDQNQIYYSKISYLKKKKKEKHKGYYKLLVAEPSVIGNVSLSNSINTYLWFDSLCVIWRHFITLFFNITKVGSGVK